jgi:hypothetical protein
LIFRDTFRSTGQLKKRSISIGHLPEQAALYLVFAVLAPKPMRATGLAI